MSTNEQILELIDNQIDSLNLKIIQALESSYFQESLKDNVGKITKWNSAEKVLSNIDEIVSNHLMIFKKTPTISKDRIKHLQLAAQFVFTNIKTDVKSLVNALSGIDASYHQVLENTKATNPKQITTDKKYQNLDGDIIDILIKMKNSKQITPTELYKNYLINHANTHLKDIKQALENLEPNKPSIKFNK